MKKLKPQLIWLTSFLTAVFVATGYELRDYFVQQQSGSGIWWNPFVIILLIVFISIIFGGGFASMASTKILSSRLYRKIFLKKSWIEGYWSVKGGGIDGNSKEPCVILIQKGTNGYGLQVDGWRIEAGEYCHSTTSMIADYDEEARMYINWFTSTNTGSQGIAMIKFSAELGDAPNLFTGKVIYPYDNKIYDQVAKRISKEEKVLHEQNAHYKNWIEALLRENVMNNSLTNGSS